MKQIKINNCSECPHYDHNGMLQANPKRICRHRKMYKDKLQDGKKANNVVSGIPYWYGFPVIGDVSNTRIKIPKWCPLGEV